MSGAITMYRLFRILLVSACVYAACCVKYPFQDTSLSWNQRVDDLVGRLTVEEIVPQTMTLYGVPTPPIPRLGIKPYIWNTECLRGQPNTNTTAFPQSIGLSSSFSGELIYNMSLAVSYEVRAHWNGDRRLGLYLTFKGLSCFSPVINILRHPLWGRNQETYGEDPYLSGSLVQSYVRGLQGNHPRYIRANAGCKHFDVHGGPENIPVSRFSFNSKLSTRDWRMTFLPQFKMCVDAGSYSLMCSYNSINGVPACANKKLMTDITRKEWGFEGYVVSDAGAITNIIKGHKYLHSNVDTAAAAIKAGCNLELSSSIYLNQTDALKDGKLTEEEIRKNVWPLFYTRMRLGEFDPEDMNPYNTINYNVIQSPAHRELAVQAAIKSFVLLKNENNLLPLTKKYNKIAVVGPFANNTDQLFGDYASNILPQYTTTVYQGLSRLTGIAKLSPGCSRPQCTDYDSQEIRMAASGADLVVVCLGTGLSLEAEGRDRANLDLAGSQLQLLKDAVAYGSGTPVLLLLFNAGALDITWAKLTPGVTAIMECFFPAQSTGEALYRTLTMAEPGAVPAGRLTATWPANINQIPPITDYTMKGRTYRYYEGDPLYPFGYGLSYTRFSYEYLNVQPKAISPGTDVHVTVGVKNVGKYPADEVIQVYMSWSNTSVPGIPKLQLAGFSRERLEVAETRHFQFVIRPEQMAVWVDDNQGWGHLTGEMTVFVGGQQPDQRTKVSSNILQSQFLIK